MIEQGLSRQIAMTAPLLLDSCAADLDMENMALAPAAVSAIDPRRQTGEAFLFRRSLVWSWESVR